MDAALSRTLEVFLVHDHHDLEVIKEIVRIIGVAMPPIVVTRLDLPKHVIPPECVPPSNRLTILQLLGCSDTAYEAPVMNAVVDQVGSPIKFCLPPPPCPFSWVPPNLPWPPAQSGFVNHVHRSYYLQSGMHH